MVKEYGRRKVSSIQVLTFFLCVLLFFLLVFFFFRTLLIEAYLFKSICQMEIFVTVYLPKECLLNK